jgi:sec-independent protein translocase protein TatA
MKPWHIIVLLAIVLLLFGGKKLPELAKGLARGMRIFRDELHGVQREIDQPTEPTSKPAEPPAENKDEKK